jgi:hypothetical protein
MNSNNLSEETFMPPKISLAIMIRLGLFQVGLGIMSVLLLGC